MSTFRLPTGRGMLYVDDKARIVTLGEQSGPLDAAVAGIETAGSGKDMEVHIRIDGATFSMTAPIQPAKAADARLFAAGLTTIARGGEDRAMRRFLSEEERHALMSSEEIAAEKKGKKVAAIVTTCVVAAVALGIVWLAVSSQKTKAPAPGPTSFTMTGELELSYRQGGYYSSDLSCTGTGGYSDIRNGAPVTVYNSDGKIVALGALGPGRRNSAEGICVFQFSVPDVPAGLGFYQYEITHRGKLTISEVEALMGTSATLGS